MCFFEGKNFVREEHSTVVWPTRTIDFKWPVCMYLMRTYFIGWWEGGCKKCRVNQAQIQEFMLDGRPVLARGLESRAAPSGWPRGGVHLKLLGI